MPRLAAAALTLILAAPAVAGPLPDAQANAIIASMAARDADIDRAALAIWDAAEVGFQERRSSALLQEELRRAGFTVEAGVAGMPTAFIARYRRGAGPVIGIMAEFDALPGLSQTADAAQTARAGSDAGHACGHNLFGAASVNAAVGVKQWMDANNIAGEIRVYGSPAEEGGSGKVFLVRGGHTRDVDAMLHWHPNSATNAAQTTALANISGKFRFTGVASHAAAAPERGRSALDGVEAMNMMVNLMREHVPQQARIHYVITDGGRAPNVVPASAEVYYYVRHPDQAQVRAIFERVQAAANGAATGTGTQVRFDQVGGTFDLLPNDTLGRVMDANLRRVGAPQWGAEERAFISRITPTLGSAAITLPDGIGPYSVGEPGTGSTDVGDVSYTTPTVGLAVATWAPGTAAHSWQAVAASGSRIGLTGARSAARTLALTAAQLMTSPDTLAAAKAELEQRRGPNFTYRSLLGDNPPRLDYRNRAGS